MVKRIYKGDINFNKVVQEKIKKCILFLIIVNNTVRNILLPQTLDISYPLEIFSLLLDILTYKRL